MNTLIKDINIQIMPLETEAYKDGWNANIKDKSVWSNPYFGTDGMEWHRGWKDCQKEWDKLPSFKNQPDYKY